MSADPVLSRELKSLQDEVAASQRARTSPSPVPNVRDAKAAGDAAAAPADAAEESAEEQKLRSELGELVDEASKFFAEAEKSVSTHPTASVVGALVVGILIGRLLAKR